MSRTLSIPAGERNRLHLFALNMIEAEAKALLDRPDAASDLLGVPVQSNFAEILRIEDLDDLGLAGYLSEGYDVAEDALQADLRKLRAVEGYALIVLSLAWGDAAHEIAIGPQISHLGSYDTEAPDWTPSAPIPSKAAQPDTSAKKTPSDAAMMGRVATLVLILLFALTGLMVWIA